MKQEVIAPISEGQIDIANSLTGTPEADTFARALDVLGWKIVRQDDGKGPWPLNYHWDYCPAWAENGYNTLTVERRDGGYCVVAGDEVFCEYRLEPYARRWLERVAGVRR